MLICVGASVCVYVLVYVRAWLCVCVCVCLPTCVCACICMHLQWSLHYTNTLIIIYYDYRVCVGVWGKSGYMDADCSFILRGFVKEHSVVDHLL